MWFPAWHFKSAFFPPSTSVILKWPDRLEFGHTEIYGLQNSPLRKYSLVLDVEGSDKFEITYNCSPHSLHRSRVQVCNKIE